ncbi:MAG: phosphatase PAP2 family protein [Nitrospirae bacterium]|nr:phosphatase PAP2 family protein [Nitrospirota bacterium]
MLDRLLDTISLLGRWGYLMMFLAAFLESSAFMGLIVPGESVVVLAGVLASQGYFDVLDCLWVISLGAVLGDSVGYTLGKALGRGYFERHKRLLFLKEKHILKVDGYFARHGGKTIFFGRFVGFLRAMAPFAAGMARMPYRRFIVYNVSGGVLWAVSFTLLGYFFGHSWRLIERWAGRAGAFAFFVLLVAAGFGYLYRTLLRRREELTAWFRERYRAVVSGPRISGFMQRHPALVSFVKERLSPEGVLGLHLTAGFVSSAVLVWSLGGIADHILSSAPFVAVDEWVLARVLYFRAPAVTGLMFAFMELGATAAIVVTSVAVAALVLSKGRTEYLMTYAPAAVGGGLLVAVLKNAVHVARPAPAVSLVRAGDLGLPSGHAMMSVVLYGMVTYFLVRDVRSWRLRAFLVTAAGFVVFMIGLSEIYLQVHYLSDVLVGYAGGMLWLSVCITGFEVYRRRASGWKKP